MPTEKLIEMHMCNFDSTIIGTKVGCRASFSREAVTLRTFNKLEAKITKGDFKHEYLCTEGL
jgi:hypothetical protein